MSRTGRWLAIPKVDEALVLEAMKQLIGLEKDLVPSAPGTSLYIRPNIIHRNSKPVHLLPR